MIEANQNCDECGRIMDKAKRIYKGYRYCATCYARIFKSRPCPKCGNLARLPKHDSTAICSKCEKDKPCARCGKTSYKIGKITLYGPVCKSCAPHFRQAASCEKCGSLSTRLTRVKRFSHDLRLCPKCARSDHGTCPLCRRYRFLIDLPNGQKLCKVCFEIGEIPCPSCNKLMPAGRGNICETCYWTKTCRKRMRLDQAAFTVAEMKSVFGEFVEWLIQQVGSNKAALKIHHYFPFFLDIEKQWQRVPTYSDMLSYFGAEVLRRNKLPMRWLQEKRKIEPDPVLQREDSEQRSIKTLLTSVPQGTICARYLMSYKDHLMMRLKTGRTSLRSVRLALKPAISLLLTNDPKCETLPNQATLDQYLLNVPGQKAAITGFINFLNNELGTDFVINVNRKRVEKRRKRQLEKKIIALMRERGNDKDLGFTRKWLQIAMEYFHDVRVPVRSNLTWYKDEQEEWITVIWNGQSYPIPAIAILNEDGIGVAELLPSYSFLWRVSSK